MGWLGKHYVPEVHIPVGVGGGGPILWKSAIVIFRQQFETFDSNTFTLSSVFSFQNAWPIKRKAVYTLVLFHIFIHFLVRIGLDRITTCLFCKTIYLISGCRW